MYTIQANEKQFVCFSNFAVAVVVVEVHNTFRYISLSLAVFFVFVLIHLEMYEYYAMDKYE